jgi:GMP synthase-like glutamine amidotransferase
MLGVGLILQHSENGPPARFAEWLRERGIPYELHDPSKAALPRVDGRPFVASLGSEHGVGDGAPEWVSEEIDALRDAIEAEVPVLGVCFGSQALAVALGGSVERAPKGEVGWLRVRGGDPSVPEGPWAQYHYEVVSLPATALELARSPVGPAAFRVGPHFGVQFHPEATPELMSKWVRADPTPPAGVTPQLIDAQGRLYGSAARAQAWRLFDGWWAIAAAAPDERFTRPVQVGEHRRGRPNS